MLECPTCQGIDCMTILGKLGDSLHLRCRNCGNDSNLPIEPWMNYDED